MEIARRRRRIPILALVWLCVLSVGTAAFTLIELPIFPTTDPVDSLQFTFDPLRVTGFSVRSLDGSLLRFAGLSKYDPAAALQPGETVQEGFVLLDGTLSLTLSATKEDGARARALTTYRMEIRPDALRVRNIARNLVQQNVVRNIREATIRARAMRLEDARVMRLVERETGARW